MLGSTCQHWPSCTAAQLLQPVTTHPVRGPLACPQGGGLPTALPTTRMRHGPSRSSCSGLTHTSTCPSAPASRIQPHCPAAAAPTHQAQQVSTPTASAAPTVASRPGGAAPTHNTSQPQMLSQLPEQHSEKGMLGWQETSTTPARLGAPHPVCRVGVSLLTCSTRTLTACSHGWSRTPPGPQYHQC